MASKKKITDYTPDSQNANKGSAKGNSILEDSIQAAGLGRSIVVDKHGRIVAGNKTWEKAGELGLEDAFEVEVDGNTLVVVKRSDFDLDNPDPANPARLYAYFDNTTAQHMQWDAEQIAADHARGLDLELVGFADYEINHLLDMADSNAPRKETTTQAEEPDDAILQKWDVKKGDVWEIENAGITHRVMCGDCLNPDHMDALMQGERAALVHTDPPYQTDYRGGMKRYEALKGDERDSTIFVDVLPVLYAHSAPDAALYLWHADFATRDVAQGLLDAGWRKMAQLIWVKNNSNNYSNAFYKNKHEPLYYCDKGKPAPFYASDTQTTVWEYNIPRGDDRWHQNEKPHGAVSRVLVNSSQRGDLVLDTFGGGGSTLLASIDLQRVGRVMEIEPHRVALMLERVQQTRGLEAQRA